MLYIIVLALFVLFLFQNLFGQGYFDARRRFADFEDDHEERRFREPWDWRRQDREWRRRYEDYRERQREREASWATLILVVAMILGFVAWYLKT
jgi:hypothetical protein